MAVFNTINALHNATDITSIDDSTAPYSFQDWKLRNANILSGDVIKQYETYLKSWYIRRNVSNVVVTNFVKDYYKTFLKTLGLAPRTAFEKQLFENVEVDNNLSLQSVIVGYARRLKDVAVYLANKRNDVYYSKLKNNLIGTSTSLERVFYSYILNAFTRKITPDGIITTSFIVSNPDILTSLPYLNVVSSNFTLQIEEIYDTSNYFDRDPSVPISTYTTVASGTPAALYNAGNYSIPEEYLIASTIEAVATANALSMATNLPAYFTFIGDGATTSFNLEGLPSNYSCIASDYQVSVEGLVQTPNDSYTISCQDQTITFSEAPPINSIVVIVKRF